MIHSSGIGRHFSDMPIRQLFFKKGRSVTTSATPLLLFLFFFIIFIFFFFLAFISSSRFDSSLFSIENSPEKPIIISQRQQGLKPIKRIEYPPLNCMKTSSNQTQSCPTNYYPNSFDPEPHDPPECPDYFRQIYEDLKPWNVTGIVRDMVERAKTTAHFRLVIVGGKAYVVRYKKSIQTRDLFTIWGLLQLLRRYPGKLPDLDLMFDCDDLPVVQSRDYRNRRQNATGPPPLFRYCGDRRTMDIVFPDWSFWGWAEINIKPWDSILKEIKEGNSRTKWLDREPYAYWKGNPFVAKTRQDLIPCNVSDHHDWNARLYIQDWIQEGNGGFKQSNLANQCTHRYKIYIEGYAWSVSEKYILACDSVTLMVKPHYYDFFTRSLQPVQHYWPVNDNDKCKSIYFAVDWGNRHKQKAQAIAKAASEFMQKELKMEYVYYYMFHLLNEYAKLLKYKPEIPEGAVEMCSETMACPAEGREREFMMESLVKSPHVTSPCTLPPPYERKMLGAFYRRKLNAIKQVEKWEKEFWESRNKNRQL
ncbi:O-glucosyltransferase rumi homolog [Tripterygium wilfordii]|nr:O-glucosyltransferase rumi homolog [Tripterygium wilfordii]